MSEITSFRKEENLVMASFDVSCIFTNIPLEGSIDLCIELLFSDNDSLEYRDCSLSRSQFHKLLSFAVKENHFVFNGQLFDQIDGVAMGSPLGPTLANIFMSVLETRYLNNCPSEFKPVLYRRYVDDTFCLFRNRDHVYSFLEYINRQHPNIKFTYELETDDALPFLDVLVNDDNDGFSTSLYRKKTFTGLYTDFSSLAPSKYKFNLVRVLIYRAFHICSSYHNFHEEIVRIKKILTDNCFPKSLIDRIIKNFLDRQFESGSSTKDRFLALMRSSVIYKLQCPGCHASYYGKTSRNLITRCREHLGVNKAGLKVKGGPSAIRDHINQSGHAASPKDFSILDRANNELDLLIHESLLILRDRPVLNSQQSSIPLVLL